MVKAVDQGCFSLWNRPVFALLHSVAVQTEGDEESQNEEGAVSNVVTMEDEAAVDTEGSSSVSSFSPERPSVPFSHLAPNYPVLNDDNRRRTALDVLCVNELDSGNGTPRRRDPRAPFVFSRSKNRRRVCGHRLNLAQEGPPCYLCSMLDVPPEYARLKKTRKGLVSFRGLAALHFPGRRRRPAEEDLRSGSSSPASRLRQEMSFNVVGRSLDDGDEAPPPPYTPLTPGSIVSRATLDAILHQQQQSRSHISNTKWLRNLLSNIMYVLLLAAAATIIAKGLDQPMVVLTIVTVLLVFTFMPFIRCLECFLQWNNERSLGNASSSESQASFMVPFIV